MLAERPLAALRAAPATWSGKERWRNPDAPQPQLGLDGGGEPSQHDRFNRMGESGIRRLCAGRPVNEVR